MIWGEKIAWDMKYMIFLKHCWIKANDWIFILFGKKCPNTLFYKVQKSKSNYLYKFVCNGIITTKTFALPLNDVLGEKQAYALVATYGYPDIVSTARFYGWFVVFGA